MIIAAAVACLLLLTTTITLWAMTKAGIEIYSVVEDAEPATLSKLKTLSNSCLFIGVGSCIYLGIWIFMMFMV